MKSGAKLNSCLQSLFLLSGQAGQSVGYLYVFVGVSGVEAKPCSIVTIKDDLITIILQLQMIKILIYCVAPISIWAHFYRDTLPRSATGNSGHSLVSSCRQSMFVSSYTHLNNDCIIYSGTYSLSVAVFACK